MEGVPGEETAQMEMRYLIIHLLAQQIFTEHVLCAVNRRHSSASRSALSSRDGRPGKQIMSIRDCKHDHRGTHEVMWSLEEGLSMQIPPPARPARLEVSLRLENQLLPSFRVLPPGSSLSWLHSFRHPDFVFRIVSQSAYLLPCYSPALTAPLPGAPGVSTCFVFQTSELREQSCQIFKGVEEPLRDWLVV